MKAVLLSIFGWFTSLFGRQGYKLSRQFQKDLEKLSKSNTDLEEDVKDFFKSFEQEKAKADRIQDCKGAFKLYMKRSGKNKSGGYRVVYFVRHAGETWFLHVYSKNQKADLSTADKKKLRKTIMKIREGEEV